MVGRLVQIEPTSVFLLQEQISAKFHPVPSTYGRIKIHEKWLLHIARKWKCQFTSRILKPLKVIWTDTAWQWDTGGQNRFSTQNWIWTMPSGHGRQRAANEYHRQSVQLYLLYHIRCQKLQKLTYVAVINCLKSSPYFNVFWLVCRLACSSNRYLSSYGRPTVTNLAVDCCIAVLPIGGGRKARSGGPVEFRGLPQLSPLLSACVYNMTSYRKEIAR